MAIPSQLVGDTHIHENLSGKPNTSQIGGGRMAGGAADERQIRVEPAVLEYQPESPPRPLPQQRGAREISSPPIPEELLLDIFRRIPDPTDLVLTSAACVTFRRLIADRSFLRQYRKLHAPPLLGFVDEDEGLQSAEPPYRSASAARAVALAGDFSFSFVPAPAPPHRWLVVDICDGRVLLGGTDLVFADGHLCTEMVVCDPLHRQYLLLPPIPDDLTASVENPIRQNFWETFLVSYGDEAAIAEETSFKVICMVQRKVKLVAFVFSSSNRQWQAIPSQSWTNLFPALLPSTRMPLFGERQYVCGCFYWLSRQYKFSMLVLDTRRMEFSIAEPPPEAKDVNVSITTMVESGEGRPRMLTRRNFTSGCEYTIWRKHGGSSSQWQPEKIFITSPSSVYCFRRSVGEYLVLEHRRSALRELSLCTLDIETLQVKRVCALKLDGCAYSNYPPSLSSPTI